MQSNLRSKKYLGSVALFAASLLCAGAHAQSLGGVDLGAPPSSLADLAMKPLAREGKGAIKMSKYALPNGNEISVTFDSRQNKILFIELDWDRQRGSQETGVPRLKFGRTSLADLRRMYVWAGRRPRYLSKTTGS